jgi:cyclopropane-fatty-acyl-phospholipid synthase
MRNQTAVTFYDLIDTWVSQGIEDFTEGIYAGNPKRNYHDAQRAQHDYLLNEARCGRDNTLLEIGCGNGTLLERVRERGARGVGITISPIQVDRCKTKGLKVSLTDYRDLHHGNLFFDELGFGYGSSFDGLVANGSLEHFVHPKDAAEERQDEIYRKMFSIFKDLVVPEGRLVTTAIHFNRVPEPMEVLANPLSHKWGSDKMHYSFVLGNLGCYYPSYGQLQRCAEGSFRLEKEIDGTEDYRITSEHWLNALWPSCIANKSFWKSLASKTAQHPVHAVSSLFQYLVTQSWNWQFRPDGKGETPTRLLRQTWKRVD